MQLVVGSYKFPQNSVHVSCQQDAVENEFGWPYEYRIRINCAGRFSVASQADAAAQEIGLRAALGKTGYALSFVRDDGGLTGINFNPSNTKGGCVTTSGPNFPPEPAQYATVRDYTFTAEATIPILNARTAIVSWQDEMSYSGGGPEFKFKPAVNGPPQKQMVWQFLPYTIIHRGTAVGYFGYPTVNPLMQTIKSPDYRYRSPKAYRGTLSNYEIDWSFEYQSNGPLNLLPIVYNPA